tara:strand:- start:177274 stop:179778 length:2505 start_codon:yes stop_codon:yes gene_type:complete
MSKDYNSSIGKYNSAGSLFIFLLGISLSLIVFVTGIEMMLAEKPVSLKGALYNFREANISLGADKTALDTFKLKIDLYKEAALERYSLFLLPISVLAIMMAWMVARSRRVMVKELLDRIGQSRRVLTQERKRKKDALVQLEKSEDHLYHIHEQLTEAFLVINKDERFHHANRVAVHILAKWNRTPKSVRYYLEQPVETFIPDYHASGLGLCVRDAISKKLSWQKELFLEKANIWLQVRVYPTGGDSAYVYMRDISNEKKPDHLKKLSEDMVGAIVETSPNALAILDRQWNYMVVSKKWREDFHLDDEGLIGKSHKALMPRLPGKWQAVEEQILNGNTVKSEAMLFQLNGKDEHVAWEISPWRVGDKVQGFMMYASIITEVFHNKEKLEQQREREHQLAYHDTLTGLPNRQLFYDRLTMGLAHAYRNLGKIALLFLDLDGFKAINDTLGHDVGDMLLKEVAVRIKKCVRDTDTVARIGGDEFTVVLNGVSSEEDTRIVADKIVKSICEVFKLGEHDIYVSTSIGISMYPLNGSTSAELIKKADSAMYFSKESGKNQANFYSEDLHANMQTLEVPAKGNSDVTQRDLESHIRTALQKEEIETFFQPQVNYKTKEVFGLEALMRWNHPTAGVLEPRAFLTLAENSGMILPMGEKVLNDIALKLKEWQEKSNEPLSFSINLSMRQLKDISLPNRMQKVFSKQGVDLSHLIVEIPESLLVDIDHEIEVALKAISQLGCKVYIDNFGLSYTSMKQLEGLPLDGIKIHKSFVQNALNSTEDKSKISAMIALVHNLNIKVIAEGVETEAQAEFLMEQGCNDMQGFVISKPSKPKNIESLLGL